MTNRLMKIVFAAAVQVLAGSSLFIERPSTLAIVVLITLIVVVGNLVVDTLYAVLDPRSFVGGVFFCFFF